MPRRGDIVRLPEDEPRRVLEVEWRYALVADPDVQVETTVRVEFIPSRAVPPIPWMQVQ